MCKERIAEDPEQNPEVHRTAIFVNQSRTNVNILKAFRQIGREPFESGATNTKLIEVIKCYKPKHGSSAQHIIMSANGQKYGLKAKYVFIFWTCF